MSYHPRYSYVNRRRALEMHQEENLLWFRYNLAKQKIHGGPLGEVLGNHEIWRNDFSWGNLKSQQKLYVLGIMKKYTRFAFRYSHNRKNDTLGKFLPTKKH